MSSNKGWFFKPRSLVGYLTKRDSDERTKDKKKRKGVKQSNLTDVYNRYSGSPFGDGGITSSYGVSPYEDLNPNSFFTEKGIEKDIDFQRKKQLPAAQPKQQEIVPDFELPDANRPTRPSLSNVFDVTERPSRPRHDVHTDTQQSEEEDVEEEIASPYEEDSFHLKPRSSENTRTRKTSPSPYQEDSFHLKASPRDRRRASPSPYEEDPFHLKPRPTDRRRVSPQTSDTSVNQYDRRREKRNSHPQLSLPDEEECTDMSVMYSDTRSDIRGNRRRDRGKPPGMPIHYPPAAAGPYPPHPMAYQMYPQHHQGNPKHKKGQNPMNYGPPFPPQGYGYPPPPHMMYPPGYPAYGMPFPGYYPFFQPAIPEESSEGASHTEGYKNSTGGGVSNKDMKQRRKPNKEKIKVTPKQTHDLEQDTADPFKDIVDVPPGLNNFLY